MHRRNPEIDVRFKNCFLEERKRKRKRKRKGEREKGRKREERECSTIMRLIGLSFVLFSFPGQRESPDSDGNGLS